MLLNFQTDASTFSVTSSQLFWCRLSNRMHQLHSTGAEMGPFMYRTYHPVPLIGCSVVPDCCFKRQH